MTKREHESLIRSLEQLAANHFPKFKHELLLMALLGYGYLLTVLVMGFGGVCVAFLLFWAKPDWVLFELMLLVCSSSLCYSVYKSMVFRLPLPDGFIVEKEATPQLFEELDALCKKINSPEIHHVIFNMEYNASVLKQPQWGGLRPTKNYLILGLPLLFSLTEEEFRAVIGHELGHVSADHSRFGRWIYRIHSTWERITAHYQSRRTWRQFIFDPFFDWFVPRFQAYAFVLIRRNEYEADQIAAAATSHEAIARSICKVEAINGYLDKIIGKEMSDLVGRDSHPSMSYLRSIKKALQSWKLERHGQAFFQKAWAMPTGYTDTHPSLRARVEALGAKGEVQLKVDESAAQVYFGQNYQSIVDFLDRCWVGWMTPLWHAKHEEYKRNENEFHKLNTRLRQGESLGQNELWNKAALAEKVFGVETALPHYQAYVEAYPSDSRGWFNFGRVLLENDNAAGEQYLEAVLQHDPLRIEEACHILFVWYHQHDKMDRAQQCWEHVLNYYDNITEIEHERSHLEVEDRFSAHDLSNEVMDGVASFLSVFPKCEDFQVYRKKVDYFAATPMYVIVVKDRLFHRLREDELAAMNLHFSSHVYFPGTFSIVSLSRYPLFNQYFEGSTQGEKKAETANAAVPVSGS